MSTAIGVFNKGLSFNSGMSLSDDEINDLSNRWRNLGCIASAQKIVLSHMRFVYFIANRYRNYGLPSEDIVQEGTVGLMKAVRSFNPDVGVKLTSYAVHWIKSEIHEYILRNWSIVKIATTKAQKKLFFNLRKMTDISIAIDDVKAESIANALSVPSYEVHHMAKRLSSPDLFTHAHSEDDDCNYLDVPDSSPSPEDYVVSSSDHEHSNKLLTDALSSLDDRSRDIIHQRWLTEEDRPTLKDLSLVYGVSTERVRQLEENAMKKLKGLLGK